MSFGFGDDGAVQAFPAAAPQAVAAGMSYARVFVAWSSVAPERPQDPRDPNDPAYQWQALDRQLLPYAATGLDVMAQLWMTPGWANGDQGATVYPARSRDFGDFAYAVALRYPQIHWWLPVNEPNLPASVQPTTIAPYEAMLRAAYAGIKAANPSAQVVAGPLAHTLGNPDRDVWNWAAQLVHDHAPMDAFAVNPYPGWNEPISVRSPDRFDIWDLPELWRVVGIPVIVAEFGWSTQLVSEADHARWMGDAIRVARCTPGLLRFTLWGLQDHPVNDEGTPATSLDNWSHFGLLRVDGTPKPALASFEQALVAKLDCAAVGRAAGAPAGWTPLTTPDDVVLTGPLPLAGSAPNPSAPVTSVSVTAAGAPAAAQARTQELLAAAHSSMRPRLLQVGRTRGRWWVSLRTSTAARVGAVIHRLKPTGPLLVRRVPAPERVRAGTRRIALGRLRAGARFRVRLVFRPLRGATVELSRSFRSPG